MTNQIVYSEYFANAKQFRFIRCTKLLKDVIESDEQKELIRNCHEDRNHRGITETYLYLKRDFYFPQMQRLINKTINNCEICQTLKYDRNPPKLRFQLTETPSKPLDILY